MPKKAKDETIEEKKKTTKNNEVASKKTTSKKTSTTKSKNETTPKITSKKPSTKKTSAKTTSKKTTKVSSTKTKKEPKISTKKIEVLEYYDLPYRYNQTIVKILAQTPNTLFVYWDISDENKNSYIMQYGNYFFNNTKPVLVIHNKTKNYSYEIDINDYANSWYLQVPDSNCDYQIELGRRPINQYIQLSNDYLYITISNNMTSQNDHILYEKLSKFVYYKNVKTNTIFKKNINLSLLEKIGKIPSTYELYKILYPNEIFTFDRLDLNNPSSNNPTSSFK